MTSRVNGQVYNLALALVALNGLDLVLTRIILDAHIGHEANPLMAYVVGSLWLFVVVKVGYPAFVGWRYVHRFERGKRGLIFPSRFLLPSMWVAVVGMVGVCVWNFRVLAVRS